MEFSELTTAPTCKSQNHMVITIPRVSFSLPLGFVFLMISDHPHSLLTVIIVVVYPLPSQFFNISSQSSTDSLGVLSDLVGKKQGRGLRGGVYAVCRGVHWCPGPSRSLLTYRLTQSSFQPGSVHGKCPAQTYDFFCLLLYFYCPFQWLDTQIFIVVLQLPIVFSNSTCCTGL